MRIRTVKPEFWTNERIALLAPTTQLLALGLLNWADDEGYFLADQRLIRGALFPFHESSALVQDGLRELEKIDYCRLGVGKDGRRYGWIVHFVDHQRISHPQESKIRPLCAFHERSRNVTGIVRTPSDDFPSGMEWNGSGMEKEGKGKQPCSNPPTAAGCEREGDLKDGTSSGSQRDHITGAHAPSSADTREERNGVVRVCHDDGAGASGDPHSTRTPSETLTVSGELAALPPAEDTNQWTKPTVAKAPDPPIVTLNRSPMTPAEKLYSHYRKKVGRAKAIVEAQKALKKVTAKLGNADAAFALLEEAVKAYSVSPTGRGKYCLDPERWFKYERWTDDRINWERPDDDRQDSRFNTRSSGGYQSGNQQADIDAGWAAADARDAAEQALAVGTGSGPPEVLDVPY